MDLLFPKFLQNSVSSKSAPSSLSYSISSELEEPPQLVKISGVRRLIVSAKNVKRRLFFNSIRFSVIDYITFGNMTTASLTGGGKSSVIRCVIPNAAPLFGQSRKSRKKAWRRFFRVIRPIGRVAQQDRRMAGRSDSVALESG